MSSLKNTEFWNWLREEPEHKIYRISLKETAPVVRIRFEFIGQVQGVGFRYVLTEASEVFGLTGKAKNNPDGTVTAEMQGAPLAIENAVHYVQLLSQYILIDDIRRAEMDIVEGERGFLTR